MRRPETRKSLTQHPDRVTNVHERPACSPRSRVVLQRIDMLIKPTKRCRPLDEPRKPRRVNTQRARQANSLLAIVDSIQAGTSPRASQPGARPRSRRHVVRRPHQVRNATESHLRPLSQLRREPERGSARLASRRRHSYARIVPDASVDSPQRAVKSDVLKRRRGRNSSSALVRGRCDGQARSEVLKVSRPGIVWIRIEMRDELRHQHAIADIAQVKAQRDCIHPRALVSGNDDTAPDGIGSSLDRVERGRHPERVDLGVSIRGCDHSEGPTNRVKAPHRLVHQHSPGRPNV